MSDRMVSCVRLFVFRKDISMNSKDRKRQIAYEVLMILGMLALLTFICRLWPILLLIILGIFVAAIRLLFLSGNRVDPVEPQLLLPAPIPAPTENDLRKLAHSLITSRITTLVLNEYPNARWIWEAPNAFELIELGEEVYILLNRAGGYRKAKVRRYRKSRMSLRNGRKLLPQSNRKKTMSSSPLNGRSLISLS